MLALALLATPSIASSRPHPRRGGALIDTRNRTDFSIKLETFVPALALAASASRKPNKAADLSALGVERLTMPSEERINALLRPSPKTTVTYLASERKVLGAAARAPALSDSISRGEVVSRPASPWLFIPLRKSQAYATLLTTDNTDYSRLLPTSNKTESTTATAYSKSAVLESWTAGGQLRKLVETGLGLVCAGSLLLGRSRVASLEQSARVRLAAAALLVGRVAAQNACGGCVACKCVACLDEIPSGCYPYDPTGDMGPPNAEECIMVGGIDCSVVPPARPYPPSIPAPPLPPGGYFIIGPCSLTDGGSCATSPNYPNSYGRNEACTISGVPTVELETVAFDVDPSWPSPCGCEEVGVAFCNYDKGDSGFCELCTDVPGGAEEGCGNWDLPPAGEEDCRKWCWSSTDYDGNGDFTDDCYKDYLTVNGKKYCGTSGPSGAVAQDGVIEWRSDGYGICWATGPPSPPAPPSPPSPPPLPPLSPGFDVAAAGGVVYAEGSGAISITGSTVAGCSTGESGGVVYAEDSGAISITGSTVSGCSAGDSGGVVYADDSGAISITGSNVSGCSAGDSGGVVYASRNGAVSIIGSNVTSCRAIGTYGGVGFQPKFKIVVSFYQVVATLGPVYGVRLHEDFTRWTDFIDSISFDLLGLTYPDACIGSMADRLLLAGLWPFAAMLLGGAAIACYALAEWLLSGRAGSLRRDLVRSTLRRLLYWAILVAYLVLPSVSRSIFKAKQCESFNINVFTGDTRSYLVADLDVLCSTDEHRGLDAYFWAFFVLWPVLVPLAFLVLLLSIRSEVRAQRVRATARASRFLWRDYDPRLLFWEVVDMGRKLFLASLVLFIQTDTGSSKILRLFVASVVSALYLAVLALARPFKRSADLYLACTANLFLACCFTSGTVIQLCESAAYEDMCKTLVGFESARGASEFVIVLTAAMLAASLLVVLFKTVSAVRAPTIRLCSSGRPPVLELSPECHFHSFISHAWGTGQDQTHTVVRRLQLLLPGVRIWLDVDNLEDVGKLEESVADANTFLVFLSAGYFKSFNCRRELYAALGKDRPFIPIFEADVAKGGASIEALKAECRENCVEVAPPAYPSYGGPDEMIARVFEEAKPIVWVRVNIFQLVSLKAVALRMLLHSPYYASRPAELADGVLVPGEAGPVAFSGPVTILVCRGNEDAFGIAEELKNAAVEGRGSTASAEAVEIRDAEEALEGANAAPCEGFPVFLLYLNDKTFLDAGGAVARLVQAAMDQGITIAMVHEQEPSCGGVPFGRFFQQTPQVLQRPPYKLFDTVAVALYPAPEHREISLRLILKSMGAVPCDAGPLRRRRAARIESAVGLQPKFKVVVSFYQLLGRLLYWAIFIFYLVLPSVSRSIFSARLCESFRYDDATGQRISFLLADPSLTCDAGPTWDDETGGLAPYFWAFFALWPVLVPLGFLALLLRVRKPVAAQRATPLSRATSFLWRDYSGRFLFWEVLDLVRKIFLTSMVLFIDQDYGSRKLLRTVVGHLCDSTACEDMCYTLVGYTTSRGATTFVVVLTAVMLAISLAVIVVLAVSASRAKTMRLVSSKREPEWHLFLSHVWSTGQVYRPP
ncbi:hypothetical protein EMIHUDRAFT_110524 [Emiliania huxleyi CCMP1516]|uniref:TIR domain-containing protein n=2 Tax=Emiliania huxleyi TaxID=2903 RepID=A0A0D3KJH8_EMIH1|nr:hypothetical protein EMIHUDRAFT_110524 [Emiliania huxleyi CCMP1516]EOD35913.1 hypothetical protein EMIHUDRAFT_110524 [Emiliania huxleyi CCMP1516]|eukprot:XP_005788342.1 hypothetical protein EMIHUDRAFT_110524 [Emiliania huxleyi CCMP1516]